MKRLETKEKTPDFITALSAQHYTIFKKGFIEQASNVHIENKKNEKL